MNHFEKMMALFQEIGLGFEAEGDSDGRTIKVDADSEMCYYCGEVKPTFVFDSEGEFVGLKNLSD